jgi:uncharacterized protein YbjT (DUF2867 family)
MQIGTSNVNGMSDLLILGGTGKVGRRLCDILTSNGHAPRVASRGGSTRFDWREESTWAAALAGVDAVFLVGPGSASDWSPALSRLLRLASRADVRHVVLLSARGVEFLPDGAMARAERAVTEGPASWTILRPTHFAQNFTEAMFVPSRGRIAAPVGEGAEPFIDARDIAEVAARVLTWEADDRYREKILALSGLSALTFTEAAAVLSEVSGTSVRFIPQTADEHVAQLRASGAPEGYVTWRMAMLNGIARGEDAYLSDGVRAVLGRPATGFSQWAGREVRDSAWAQRSAADATRPAS